MANSSALDVRQVSAWARTRRIGHLQIPYLLRLAIVAAPLCWLAQIVIARITPALLCSNVLFAGAVLRPLIVACDVLALTGACGGGVAAWSSWRQLHPDHLGSSTMAGSRLRLLAMWSMMASLWLFGAILFNAIGSIPGLTCVG